MYLFSCPSIFCKASLDTLFSLSTCIFCPIIKYICKHTLYEVLLNSNMKSILKRIHSYIRFWRNIFNNVPITLNYPSVLSQFCLKCCSYNSYFDKRGYFQTPPPLFFRSTHVPSLEPSWSLKQSLSRLIFKILIWIRYAQLPAKRF